MKGMKFAVLISAITIISLSSVFAQKKDFNGEWKINYEKTKLGEVQLYMTGIKVAVRNDTLFTTRTYQTGDGQEYPFEENITLDGKDCKITVYEMPRTSKGTLSAADGTIKLESITTFTGNNGQEDYITKETWKVDGDGNTLIIDNVTRLMGNEYPMTFYYNRIK